MTAPASWAGTPPTCPRPCRAACGLVVLFILAARPADAQICAGRASFNIAPTHVELDAGTNTSGRGLGVSVGHGRDALFGIVSWSTDSADGAGRVGSLAGTLATDQPLSPDNKLHVCPMITVGYVSEVNGAPEQGGHVGASIAADASRLVVNTPRLKVMPTIGLTFATTASEGRPVSSHRTPAETATPSVPALDS